MLEVQMAIFAGPERLTFNDIKRESGNVTSLIETAERYIRNNIRWRVIFDGSMQRKEIPEIPMDAVREALINSYCHRLYTSSQNNEVTIHSNRVEIYNPGTFPEGMTPQDFIGKSERSIKRNPLLAQLMYYTKDIESFGTGLTRITDACNEAGINVDFDMLKNGFSVIFYRPDVYDVNDDSIVDNIVENIGDNNAVQEKIISLMREKPQISSKQLAEIIGIAQRNIQVHIKKLKDGGVIEREGPAFGGHWIVK